jgi:guanylate kinase
MKKANLFCLIGKTGAGKSEYLNRLCNDKKFMNGTNLTQLVYGTTRSKREKEIDGVHYHFHTIEEYENIPQNDLVEFRSYYTLNDGEVFYFTKSDYIDPCKNIICITSPYQYESYRNWCNIEKIKKHSNIYIHMIYIDTDIRCRVERAVSRAKTDDDIYELCRRAVQEKIEFEDVSKRIPELIDPMQSINVCFVDNNCDFKDGIDSNLEKIKKYIRSVV